MAVIEKKVMCPECDKEVTLKDGEGTCVCGLDVGWVLERRRRDRALEKLKSREEKESADDKRAGKKDRWSFD